MRLTPPEPDFVPGSVGFDCDKNGHSYDLIGRKALGERLSELVERFDQPLVIALDDDWGSGKSHFLKLWTGAHGLENGGSAKIIYFDAFQHDYLDDPMISLIGAVIGASAEQPAQGAEKPFFDRAIERLKPLAWKLAKPAVRIGKAWQLQACPK